MDNSNGVIDQQNLPKTNKDESVDKDLKLRIPDGAEALPYQIAGHRFGQIKQQKKQFGVLKHSQSGDILKPVYDKRSRREQLLYETIFSKQNEHDECIDVFRKIVPKFNGLFHDDHMNIDYIRIGDITANMINSSLLDIKMGTITYDPEAHEEKRRSEKNKYKYVKDLGFRILGMRIYDRTKNEVVYKNKEYGLQVTPETASEALVMFAQNDLNLLQDFVQQVTEIEHWFKNHNVDRWKFISSSLLFAYGQPISSSPQTNDSNRSIALVKMIDFAHVFPNVGLDENYLFGLLKLKYHLQKATDSLV